MRISIINISEIRLEERDLQAHQSVTTKILVVEIKIQMILKIIL